MTSHAHSSNPHGGKERRRELCLGQGWVRTRKNCQIRGFIKMSLAPSYYLKVGNFDRDNGRMMVNANEAPAETGVWMLMPEVEVYWKTFGVNKT